MLSPLWPCGLPVSLGVRGSIRLPVRSPDQVPENRQMNQELHAHRNDKKHQVRRPLATEICGRGPHCPISTPRVQQRGSRMVAAVATGAICSPSLGSGMRYGRRSRWIGRRMCALAASSEHARAAEGHARCTARRREEGQTAREDNRR